MIPPAIKAIKESKIVKTDNNGIESKYFGYINGFGPAVITSGLLNTVNYYSKEGSDGQNEKKKICDILLKILRYSAIFQFQENSLLALTQAKNTSATNEKLNFKNRVLEAVAACKLAIGTFKKIKADGE